MSTSPPPPPGDDGEATSPGPPTRATPPPPAPPPPATPPPATPPPGIPPPAPGGATGNWAVRPAATGGDESYDVVSAFRYGWDQFMAQPGPILLGVLVLLVGSVVVGGLWVLGVALLAGASESGGVLAGTLALVVTVVGLLGYLAVAFLVQAGIVRAGLAIVDGRRLEPATLLRTDRLGTVVASSLLVALLTAVGSVLFVLPGVVFAFLAQFFLFFVLDRGEGAWDAIVSSLRFSVDHLVPMLLLYLLSGVAATVGALLCGVGLLVAFPVIVIAQAYTFRVLQGQPVAG